MKVGYITCIKDEEVLIYAHLAYYYNIGVRDFYIMFNNSADGTEKEVDRFEQQANVHITRYYDSDIAYRQPERFTMMSDKAYNDGCTWILPVDADEIIKIPEGKTIQDCLRPHDRHEYGHIRLDWIDYHPGGGYTWLNQQKGSYFTAWTVRESKPRPQGKLIIKWSPGMRYGDGHHILTAKRKHICDAKIMFMAHFPARSLEQLYQKKINIGKAFIAYFGEGSTRPQVLEYYKILKEGRGYVENQWAKICEHRTNNKFIYDPIDPELFSLDKHNN